MKPSAVVEPRRAPAVDLRVPLSRAASLPWRRSPAADDNLGFDQIIAIARTAREWPGAFLLAGGDPLERTDLPELLAHLATFDRGDLGVCTLGYGADKTRLELLRSAGLRRLSVSFHSARQDAHDWLVGRHGALKLAHRAIRAGVDAALSVEAEVVLTRPTMLHLAETVEVLARIGVRRICVRRLTAMDIDAPGFVALSPRLFLLEESLEKAAAVALQRGVRLILRDLPVCVAPRLRPLFAAPDREVWLLPDGSARGRGEASQGCGTCTGLPRCAGVPADYVSRFGWEEFAVPNSPEARIHETVSEQKAEHAAPVMSFAWSGPRRVACEFCGDARDSSANGHAQEPTRVVRSRLVQAARYRPSRLRLVGADLLAHPQAAPLIYDALRLFRRVEVAAEAGFAADWSDLDLRRLKDLERFDFALYGADAEAHDAHCGIAGAFAAMQRAVARLRESTGIAVGGYAVLHDADAVPAFAEAWEQGRLPGTPRFRLSARGASLDDLVQCARELPAGAARAALIAVLPRCLCEQEGLESADAVSREPQQHVAWGRRLPYQPCGSDPLGTFEPCAGMQPCASSGCQGAAAGWYRSARSTQWTASL
jgi:hypothetical protein